MEVRKWCVCVFSGVFSLGEWLVISVSKFLLSILLVSGTILDTKDRSSEQNNILVLEFIYLMW